MIVEQEPYIPNQATIKQYLLNKIIKIMYIKTIMCLKLAIYQATVKQSCLMPNEVYISSLWCQPLDHKA